MSTYRMNAGASVRTVEEAYDAFITAPHNRGRIPPLRQEWVELFVACGMSRAGAGRLYSRNRDAIWKLHNERRSPGSLTRSPAPLR